MALGANIYPADIYKADIYPALAEFRALARKYNMVPVYTTVPADMETPISIYLKLVGDDPGFMLESAESGQSFGRYSFIGFNPLAELAGRSEESELVFSGGKQKTIAGRPLDVLQEFLVGFSSPALPGQPPFLGGGVGYFAYDIVTTFERVRGYRCPKDLELMRLLFCRLIVILDHLKHTLQVVCLAPVEGPDPNCEEIYREAVREIRTTLNKLSARQAAEPDDAPYRGQQEKFSPPAAASETGRRYMAMVEKAKEYIAAGDAFQIVLSHNFEVPLSRHPFNLYRRLRQVNPSPYMFYLNFGAKKLIGASPEMLVKVEGEKVSTCPIAGTRPRGASDAEDARLAAELLADTKEKAEHAMLVDLGRNDLGRISVPGTVNVERFMQVEKFSHVMHLVSTVSGRLDPGYTALDVLKACFPAGTLSGAPKVRAMEIIHELEGDCRGAYGGAVGYLDFRGSMDTCITIRTIVVDGGQAAVRTGAGIVYDSVPEAEYQEVLHKGRALFKLLTED